MKIKEILIGVLFPPHCPLCDELIPAGETACAACRKKVLYIKEPLCKKCGKPLENPRQEYCTDCGRKKHQFDQGKAVFVYQGQIRQSMYRFKYNNKREYAGFYASEAMKLYERWIEDRGIDVIVPVPMYRPKQKGRGYNQAETFAAALAGECGLPVDAGLVRRRRNTTPQKELNDLERKKNLENAFDVTKENLDYKNVLVVDDIYTTGSTVDAVAKVLKEAGAEKVYFLCISIGEGF